MGPAAWCWCAALVVAVSVWWRRERQKYASLDGLPGPAPLPVLGNIPQLLSTDNEFFYRKMREWARTYKDIYVLWILNKPIINIYNPEDVEVVLSSPTLTSKSFFYDFVRPWLLDGLLLSSGSKWQSRRKILTPAFHFNILKVFSGIIEENSWRFVAKLQREVDKDKTDIRKYVAQYTLDTICETSMGTKLDEESEEGSAYISNIGNLGDIALQRVSCFWLHNDFVFNLSSMGKKFGSAVRSVHAFTSSVITPRRQHVRQHGSAFSVGESSSRKRLAMLDLMLEAEKDGKIDATGVLEEVETFMFAGHDSTFVAITYILMMLANHEEHQNKVYEELVETFGTSLQPASIEQLSKLTYLGACVKETLRIMPSAPLISRHIPHDVQLKSCKVPAGTTCHVHILDLHRRADLWDEPMSFRPERFLAEAETASTASPGSPGRHPFAYVPFSAGPRNCIGQKFAMMEMKSAVAAILRSYRMLPVTRPHEVKVRADTVLRPQSPVYIKFQQRQVPVV